MSDIVLLCWCVEECTGHYCIYIFEQISSIVLIFGDAWGVPGSYFALIFEQMSHIAPRIFTLELRKLIWLYLVLQLVWGAQDTQGVTMAPTFMLKICGITSINLSFAAVQRWSGMLRTPKALRWFAYLPYNYVASVPLLRSPYKAKRSTLHVWLPLI